MTLKKEWQGTLWKKQTMSVFQQWPEIPTLSVELIWITESRRKHQTKILIRERVQCDASFALWVFSIVRWLLLGSSLHHGRKKSAKVQFVGANSYVLEMHSQRMNCTLRTLSNISLKFSLNSRCIYLFYDDCIIFISVSVFLRQNQEGNWFTDCVHEGLQCWILQTIIFAVLLITTTITITPTTATVVVAEVTITT